MFEAIFSALISTEATFAMCALIAGAGLVSAICFLRNYNKIRDDIDLVTDKIIPPPSGGIRAVFDSRCQEFKNNSTVAAAWEAFSRQVLTGPEYGIPAPAEGRLYSKKDPSVFFNEESLWLNRFDEKIFSAVPSLLTGAGIFGTFIGLAAGVGLAAPNIGSFTGETLNVDAETFSEAFQPLLNGAGQAFWTSIVGLFGSIVYTIIFKQNTHNILVKIEKLNNAIAQGFEVLTPEQIALMSHKVQADQLAFTRQMSEGWNTGMKEMMASITESFASLEGAFKGFSSDQLAELHGLMHGIVNTFSKELAGEMARMSGTFEKTSEAIDKTVVDLDASLDKLNSITKESALKAGEVMQVLDEHLASITTNLTDTASSMKSACREATAAVDLVGSKVKAFTGEAASLIKETGAEFSASAKTGGDGFLKSVEEGCAAVKAQAEETAGKLQNVTESAAAQLKDGAETVLKASEETSQNIRSAGDGAAGQIREAGNAFTYAVDHMGKSFQDTVSESSKKLLDSAEHEAAILGKAADFQESLTSLQWAIAGLASDLADAGETVKQSVDSVEGIEASVRSIMEGAKAEMTEANQASVAAVRQALGEVTAQIASVTDAQSAAAALVRETQDRIAETAAATQQQIAAAADQTQKGLSDSAEQFAKFLVGVSADLAEAREAASASFNKNVTDLDNGIASAVTNLRTGFASWQKNMGEDRQTVAEAVNSLREQLDRLQKVHSTQAANMVHLNSAQEKFTAAIEANGKQFDESVQKLLQSFAKLQGTVQELSRREDQASRSRGA